jgi:lipoate-protein ligase B
LNKNVCSSWVLGRLDYKTALGLQGVMVRRRARGEMGDTLLLLEHPATYTLGRRGDRGNLLVSPQSLAREGIPVYPTDRGGDVTFHGPGQLVGYPVLDIKALGLRVAGYMRRLEEVLIQSMAGFDVRAGRVSDLTGVWVGSEKVAAMGVRIDARGITSHGFALNVATDLGYFSRIVPCGIRGMGVTSLSRVLARTVSMEEVVDSVVSAFGRVFSMEMKPLDPRLAHSLLERIPHDTGCPSG